MSLTEFKMIDTEIYNTLVILQYRSYVREYNKVFTELFNLVVREYELDAEELSHDLQEPYDTPPADNCVIVDMDISGQFNYKVVKS